MSTKIENVPLGGPAWLKLLADDKEEMLHALGAVDEEARKEEQREIQGLRDAARRLTLCENALQVIMDETQKHHEYNPVSKTARLSMGYRKILNTAHHALNS